jgi:hypothetical protein
MGVIIVVTRDHDYSPLLARSIDIDCVLINYFTVNIVINTY